MGVSTCRLSHRAPTPTPAHSLLRAAAAAPGAASSSLSLIGLPSSPQRRDDVNNKTNKRRNEADRNNADTRMGDPGEPDSESKHTALTNSLPNYLPMPKSRNFFVDILRRVRSLGPSGGGGNGISGHSFLRMRCSSSQVKAFGLVAKHAGAPVYRHCGPTRDASTRFGGKIHWHGCRQIQQLRLAQT